MAGLAAVVALFFVFASGDDGAADPATQAQGAQSATRRQPVQSTTRSQSAKSTEGTTRGRSPKPQTPTIERIVVRGGDPVGGVKRFEVESGEQVRFSVRSDMADDVHVHGFDIEKRVPARGTVRFRFVANIEGVFEIELHHSGIQIGELRIKP
jgi:hypothetical protein